MSVRPNLAACALLIATLGVAASAASPTQSLPAHTNAHPPSTLRIGLWTLWHDKQVSIAPNPAAAFRLCETCPASALDHPIQIRASANQLVLPPNRFTGSVWLSGPLTLAAHGESLALHNPIRITARNGELVLSVILPVETYVERVVSSESGPADSWNRSKRWPSSSAPLPSTSPTATPITTCATPRIANCSTGPPCFPNQSGRPRRHAFHCGRNPLVPLAARPSLVPPELRRPNRFSARSLALQIARPRPFALAHLARRPLLHPERGTRVVC